MINMFTVRQSIPADKQKILALYRQVARVSGGIARSAEEISEEYIEEFMHRAILAGMELVVEHADHPELIIAEMHGHKMIPAAFAHVMSNLTIAVHPEFQGKGIGKMMFTRFIEHISNNRPDILRVELVTQESNTRALSLYQSIGFVIEGRLEKRIWFPGTAIKADIPLAWFNKNFNP